MSKIQCQWEIYKAFCKKFQLKESDQKSLQKFIIVMR